MNRPDTPASHRETSEVPTAADGAAAGSAIHPAERAAALRHCTDRALGDEARSRLAADTAAVAADPAALHSRFPAAGRRYGRGPLPEGGPPGWRVEDAVRTLWLLAAPLEGAPLAHEVTLLYRHGDAAERRGVLHALPYLAVGELLVELVDDAVRTNDPRLVGAAVGPYAARHLDQHRWRQAVLKCLFIGVPLDAVAGLAERGDSELTALARGLAEERRAAGRPVPPDVARLAGG